MVTTPWAPTIVALLRAQAQQHRDSTLYRYLADGENETRSITYGELASQAHAVAAHLQRHAAPGDRALILCEDAIDFARAFMGCQLAGIIAVPVSPPFPSQRGRRIATLRAIARDSRARLVAGGWPEGFVDRVKAAAPELAELRWLAIDQVPAGAASECHPVHVDADDVAFLQYTSGSTSVPRGVVVTHDMLVHNEAYMQRALAFTERDVMVSWLPLFHDMGLIGVLLLTLYCGGQGVVMPPAAFARRPLNWLAAISRYHGTIAAAPDSAYRLCAAQITPAEREGLDLRNWRVAADGAEPVSFATLAAFSKAFEPCGFRKTSWFPTYGLAESTLMTTGAAAGAGATTLDVNRAALENGRAVPGAGKRLVGCGKPTMHRRVEIVDPQTFRRVEAGSVGEIWIGGPDVARRYWGSAGESEHVFCATLANSGEGPFLRSGDLGFVWDDELYVSGRLKDLIIIGGRNHHPQDIEATALAAHRSLIPGACVAFGVERDGAEMVVVVAEVQPPRLRPGVRLAEVAEEVRLAVTREHGVAVAEVALVDRKRVPRTSSGKLQRRACRAAFERGELDRAQTFEVSGDALAAGSHGDPRQAVRRVVTEQLERILSVAPDEIDTTAAFQELGLDSIKAAELATRLERVLGRRFSAKLLYAEPTTERLIERLLEELAPPRLVRDVS